MEPSEIVEEFSSKINSIVYTKNKKTWDVSEKITIGWDSVLPEPPENNSKITLKELKYLSELTNKRTSNDLKLVGLVDNEPLDLFMPIIRREGLYFNKEDFNKVWNIARPIIMNLKHQYNRPRPEQLSPFFGLKINVQKTNTHQTPAYPSGHTSYSAFAAYMLSDMHPRFSGQFFNQVGVAGYARCLQGVHYPSDNEAAMTISGAIWEDIKYDLFPELYPVTGE